MKTAIALFGNRVSPRFDCTGDFLIVTVGDQNVSEETILTLKDDLPSAKARCLSDINVDTLICGGVDVGSEQALGYYGIKIVPNIKGEVQNVLNLFLKGELGR
nr:NifB/NifX family molybdenum-iron cluster-binding protein [Desulfobulbaceae bacterium]